LGLDYFVFGVTVWMENLGWSQDRGDYTMEKHVQAFGSCHQWDRIILGCMDRITGSRRGAAPAVCS
jgi:hypothetical protein